ncbi:hypothetical protein BZL30_0173 [Mycobacterium kansasii]|uniref:Uncharacterized protein n=1 Tax=Mycobacterium kansasii TaxID=1768 RepID=A0A1V3XU36_MYCKA|nr:hypothetical protein BZL30_0173 [Mycobacterium kansasii]
MSISTGLPSVSLPTSTAPVNASVRLLTLSVRVSKSPCAAARSG